jgi:DNA-binding protein H-NS
MQTKAELDEAKLQVGILENKLEEQMVIIEELEKRREAAKKEIKQLYVKLNKKEALKPTKPDDE